MDQLVMCTSEVKEKLFCRDDDIKGHILILGLAESNRSLEIVKSKQYYRFIYENNESVCVWGQGRGLVVNMRLQVIHR